MVNVSFTGPWQQCINTLNNITKNLHPMMDNYLEKNAEYLVKEIRGHIDSQDLSWEPLAPYTVAKKGSTQVYYEYGQLYDSFDYQFSGGSKKGNSVFVGAGDGSHTVSGKTFADILETNEYGDMNVPARPIIGPTYQISKNQLIKNLQDDLNDFFSNGGTF